MRETRPDRTASARADESVTDIDRPTDPFRAERRFGVLAELDAREGAVDLETLADALAAADADPERVAIGLHHVDLPSLVAAGLVAYDPERRVASLVAEDAAVSPRDGDH